MDAVSLEFQVEAALQDLPAAFTRLIETARAVEEKQRRLEETEREILVIRAELTGLAARVLQREACWKDAGDAVRTALARRFLFMRWCCHNGVVSDYGPAHHVAWLEWGSTS